MNLWHEFTKKQRSFFAFVDNKHIKSYIINQLAFFVKKTLYHHIMKYFLIDTCSWINLIDHGRENPQIDKLSYWIQEGLIELIVPELIIKEWNEHKENEKVRIQEQWKTKQKHYNEYV